jgi:hypothetical protein
MEAGMEERLRCGIFLAPFHPVDENPTLALERDFELVDLSGTLEQRCEQYVASGYAVIGDPDDATTRIEQLRSQSGGFGPLLLLAHNWADWVETRRSYELVARYVMPRFRGDNAGRQGSMEWAAANRTALMEAGRRAKVEAARKRDRERAGRREP